MTMTSEENEKFNKWWANASEEEKQQAVAKGIAKLKKDGFPWKCQSPEEREKNLRLLCPSYLNYDELILKGLLDHQEEVKNEILDKLSKLPRAGEECNCDGRGVRYIYEGEVDEIIEVCLKCGGVKV